MGFKPTVLVLLALLLALLAAGRAHAACPAGPERQGIGGLALLRDPTGTLGVEAVAARDADFTPLFRPPALGRTRDAVWLRFCLSPRDKGTTDHDRPRWLRIAPAHLDEIALHLPRAGGHEVRRGGDHQPFVQREWPYRLPVFSVPQNVETGRPAYLRVRTDGLLYLNLDLWSETEFRALVARDSAGYGGYGGAILLLVVFALISWRWLRDPIYLIYGANALAGAGLLLLCAGLGSQYLYPASVHLNDLVPIVAKGVAMALHLLFFIHLFAIDRKHPRLAAPLRAVATLYLMLGLVGLAADPALVGRVFQLLGLPIALASVPLLLWLGWRDRERRIYLPALLPWAGADIFLDAHRQGWIDEGWLIGHGEEIGSLIYLLILPLLLTHRAWREKTEKEVARARELADARWQERELARQVAVQTTELRREIEARRILHEQVEKSLATKQATLENQRRFVAMLSHEFRTPLTIIDNTAQRLALTPGVAQATLTPRIHKIRRAVARLLNLLENCLADERLHTASLHLMLEDTDLRQHLIHAYGDAHLAGAQRIVLELPDQPVWVRCDRHLFDIALGNLVDNALKYSGEDSPVTLSLLADPSQNMALIRVRDRGIGIRPEDRPHIFDKFFRAEGGQRISGAGLGLHLTRELAHRHSGDVTLELPPPGGGTVFTLSLPLAGQA